MSADTVTKLRLAATGRDCGENIGELLQRAADELQAAGRARRADAFNVNIPPEAWEKIGDVELSGSTDTRLLSTATINGHFFHVEAIAVAEAGEDGIRHAIDESLDENIDHACAINGCSCEAQRIGERDYVITIIPFEA